MFYKFFIFSFLAFLVNDLAAQNLVPNPSFEQAGVSPLPCGLITNATSFNNSNNYWVSGNQTSPNIFSTQVGNTCENYTNNNSNIGQQTPHSGSQYAAIQTFGHQFVFNYNSRSYLQVPLNSDLISGHQYYYEFYVSLADSSKYATDNICLGGAFSLPNYNTVGYENLSNINVLTEQNTVILEQNNWEKISGIFVSDSNYSHLVIGNFKNVSQTNNQLINPLSQSAFNEAIYFLDDIQLIDTTCITTSGDITICPGDSATLSVTVINGGGVSWTLDTTDTEQGEISTSTSITVDPDTTTTYFIMTDCGIDSIVVNVYEAAKFTFSDTTVCEDEFVVVQLPILPNQHYIWYDGSYGANKVIEDTGMIWFKSYSPCDTIYDTTYVHHTPFPNITQINTFGLCSGQDTLVIPEIEQYTYVQWTGGLPQLQKYINQPGSYELEANNNGCWETMTFDVFNYDTFHVELGVNRFICEGDSMVWELPPVNGYYLWNETQFGNRFVADTPGVYTVEFRYKDCVYKTDTVKLVEYDPDVDLGNDTTICYYDFVSFDLGHIPHTKMLWDGEHETSVISFQSGYHYVEVFMEDCYISDTILISAFPKHYFNITGDTFFLCPETEQWFDLGDELYILDGTDSMQVIWNTGDTTPSIIVDEVGLYYANIIDHNGCIDSLGIEIAECPPKFPDLPNVFTPNWDGRNDYAHPINQDLLGEFTYEIYSRWGVLVYSGDQTSLGWDGRYKGEDCTEGNYYYVFRHKTEYFEGKQILTGTIALIRGLSE
ncbi:MAG: gliding motility-associated C-terminal domain-containing protein [Flavobacteriales bacterium]|jgi:gliding motility-associated-like protein|nr:gliding motility-associated C-terminal domain-containing protein [Flavobacteriales bacterium]